MTKGRRKGVLEGLAQREQQALDMLYKHGPSSANELQAYINDDLSNATVRTILRILETKGYVKHYTEGKRFIYQPTEKKSAAAKDVFDKLVDTFFSGSATDAVATFIDKESKNLADEDFDEMIQLINQAKQKRNL